MKEVAYFQDQLIIFNVGQISRKYGMLLLLNPLGNVDKQVLLHAKNYLLSSRIQAGQLDGRYLNIFALSTSKQVSHNFTILRSKEG